MKLQEKHWALFAFGLLIAVFYFGLSFTANHSASANVGPFGVSGSGSVHA
jgi:hypothetical protein